MARAKNTRHLIKAAYISDHDEDFDWKFEEDNKEEETIYKTTGIHLQGKPVEEEHESRGNEQVERQWTTLRASA